MIQSWGPDVTPTCKSTVSAERPRTARKKISIAGHELPRRGHSSTRLPLRTAFRNFSDMVEIVVGEESGEKDSLATTYLVHRELVVAVSPFFAAALNGNFTEGLSQTIRLPEEQPENFEWFLQWLYTGALTTPKSTKRCTGGTGIFSEECDKEAHRHMHTHDAEISGHTDGDLRNSAGSPKYFLLLDLWGLSDRLLTTGFSNLILSTIARLSESTNSVLTPKDTWILYDSIRDGAPLRALVLDLFAYKKTDKLLETHSDEWHPRFLRDLVVKLKRPGREIVERHDLAPWNPRSWSHLRVCDFCHQALRPGTAGIDRCRSCNQIFCATCLHLDCTPTAGYMPYDSGGCKPWTGRGLCLRYHEHDHNEACS